MQGSESLWGRWGQSWKNSFGKQNRAFIEDISKLTIRDQITGLFLKKKISAESGCSPSFIPFLRFISVRQCSSCSAQQKAECKESAVFPCLTQEAQFTPEGQVRRTREQSEEDSEGERVVLSCSALLLLPQVYALLPLLRCACCQLHPWVAEAMVLVLEALLPCFCTLFFLTLLPGVEPAVPLEDFYPFGRDKGDSQTIAQDDGGSGLLEISVAFPFFGDRHTGLYVSTEECVSADVFWSHWLWVCMHLVAGNWIWNVVDRIRASGSWDVAHSQILHCGTLREFVYVHVEYRVFPSRV